MEDNSIRKLLFNQIEYLVKVLENDAKKLPLNKELVFYSEGKLNECIRIYFKLFPFESLPDSLWDDIVHAWSLVNKKEEKE